jgi:hypothetical protein
MQSSSSSRSFKPGLAGASPATDAILVILDLRFAIENRAGFGGQIQNRKSKIENSRRSQGVSRYARRSAKAEVRGAIPRESARFKLRFAILDLRLRIAEGASPSIAVGLIWDNRKSQISSPLCLSSYRASFVNSYSSV